MKRIVRVFTAFLMLSIFILSASSVWAAERLTGSVPDKPPVGTSGPVPTIQSTPPGIPITGIGDAPGAVNMGTAILAPLDPNVTLKISAVINPVLVAPQPEGLEFAGDTFLMEASSPDALAQICFAYAPEMEAKMVTIFKLNQTLTPPVWEPVPEPIKGYGMICAVITPGYVSLIGNP